MALTLTRGLPYTKLLSVEDRDMNQRARILSTVLVTFGPSHHLNSSFDDNPVNIIS